MTNRATDADHVPCVMYENHAQDSRYKGPLKVAQTVSATYGTGGNNQPLIVQSVDFSHADDVARTGDVVPALQSRGYKGGNCVLYCIEGNGSRESHRGDGYAESETMYTLNTIERHAVAYCIGNGQVHDAVNMEREKCKTLNCMEDPMKILIEM